MAIIGTLTSGPAARLVEDVMDACAMRAERDDSHHGYLGMSSIGQLCELRIWRGHNHALTLPIEGKTARIFANGHATEERVIGDIVLAGYRVSHRQHEVSDFGGRFAGHIDGVLHGLYRKPVLLEVKSAGDSRFQRFQFRGMAADPAYIGQVQCYMGYTGLRKALFVVENKNNQELYAERVRFDPAAFAALREKAWRILNSGTPPPGVDRTGCHFCDFKPVCEHRRKDDATWN
jgi:hypothetical protein